MKNYVYIKSKNNINGMILFLLSIFLFFSIFGPKVGGLLDLMLLVPAYISVILFSLNKSIFFPRIYAVKFFLFISLTISFCSFSLIINHSEEFQIILRLIRAAISSSFIFLFFFYLKNRQGFKVKFAFFILIGVLACNLLAVYVEVFFPGTQTFMAKIYGFDKSIRGFRAFGLTTGYDSSGYLVALLSSILLTVSFVFNSWICFLCFLVSATSVIFTSRTSMVFVVALIICTAILIKSELIRNFSKLVITVLIIGCGLIIYLLQVLSFSLIGFSNVFYFNSFLPSIFRLDRLDYADQFAQTDFAKTFDLMAVLPQNLFTWFFGNGTIVTWSDIGYIKVLFQGGLPLLAAYIIFYVYLIKISRETTNRFCNKYGVTLKDAKWLKVFLTTQYLMAIIMFVGNFKNLYFFTRGYHELFLSLTVIILCYCNNPNNSEYNHINID